MTATSLVILLKLYEDHRFFVPYDLAMWWMTSKYNKALFLCHVKREREIKFMGLFENRGHRGPYSPYKPFNHNLYIGIIIFPHIDNPQSTGYN